MKIALFSPGAISPRLGATKNRLELAHHLRQLGWDAEIFSPGDIGLGGSVVAPEQYAAALKNYLVEHSAAYDVVLYEYNTLPFDRAMFDRRTLFIARPALLEYWLKKTPFRRTMKDRFREQVVALGHKLTNRTSRLDRHLRAADISLANADLVQVQNSMDAAFVGSKFPGKDVIIVPNGIDEERRARFAKLQRDYSGVMTHPVLAFVGTFDYRKGGLDIVDVVADVAKAFPGLRVKLIGTRGLFTDAGSVWRMFPSWLRKAIDVIPTFDPEDLPGLLEDCHVGLFPSYFESFGYGALEMMSAGLPVVGYRAQGPCDFLIDEISAEIGDKRKLTEDLLRLLASPALLADLSARARRVADGYQWMDIARIASNEYLYRLERLRA